jgi:ubiquinone/menaquinone biosynthesis C-methylase UbiE
MQGITNDTTLPGFFPATAMPDSDWWQALWPHPQQVLAALTVRPDMEVVDLCCGDGLFTASLALMVRHIIAIDIDPGMLALARSKVSAAGPANCEFIEGDAYAIADLVRRPVDFVLITNTFHGFPDKPRLARAAGAILKPRGLFAIVNWHHRPREETIVLGNPRGPKTEMRMKPSDVAAEVEPANLKLVSVVELPPYHYGVIFEKMQEQPRRGQTTQGGAAR